MNEAALREIAAGKETAYRFVSIDHLLDDFMAEVKGSVE